MPPAHFKDKAPFPLCLLTCASSPTLVTCLFLNYLSHPTPPFIISPPYQTLVLSTPQSFHSFQNNRSYPDHLITYYHLTTMSFNQNISLQFFRITPADPGRRNNCGNFRWVSQWELSHNQLLFAAVETTWGLPLRDNPPNRLSIVTAEANPLKIYTQVCQKRIDQALACVDAKVSATNTPSSWKFYLIKNFLM